jgi:hypothetical protein
MSLNNRNALVVIIVDQFLQAESVFADFSKATRIKSSFSNERSTPKALELALPAL